MNGKEIIFIQVKTNRGDVSKAVKEFAKHQFPPTIRKIVVCWPERASVPEIFEG
jgi:hypothetical protein